MLPMEEKYGIRMNEYGDIEAGQVFAEPELTDFQGLMEEAVGKIHKLCPSWSNYNTADSGMAVLELFAYMTELQQFHACQIGKSHIYAFMNLLGISPGGFVPARTLARFCAGPEIRKPFLLLKGSRVRSQGLVWETEKTLYIVAEAVSEEKNIPFYPFGKSPESVSFYDIRLKRGLIKGYTYSVYFDVQDSCPVKRNPIEPDSFIPPVSLELEYREGDCGVKCELMSDETFGLFQPGYVWFRLTEESSAGEHADGESVSEGAGGFCLRLRAEGEYDTAPLLNGIYLCTVPLVQKYTGSECREYVFSRNAGEVFEAEADTRNGVYGSTEAYRRDGKGWRRLEPRSVYMRRGRKYFVFDPSDFGNAAQPEAALVSVNEGQSPEDFVFDAGSGPGRTFYLPDRNILGSELVLWVEEEKDYYVPWRRVNDLAAAGSSQRCYSLDEREGLLRFGDGAQGMALPGKIKLVGYALCEGRHGNIKKGHIFEFEDAAQNGTLYNPEPGTGGRDPETADECIGRFRGRKTEAVLKRAVTAKDYEELIRRTPGLRIRNVRAFPSSVQDSRIEAVVQPFTDSGRMPSTDIYLKNIAGFMESRRLLGTELLLKYPGYIGITVYLEAALRGCMSETGEKIEEKIRDYFNTAMDFGKPVIYSLLYGYIDSLPEIAGIHELSLYGRGIGYIAKENGDIDIPRHGIACLENLKLRCVGVRWRGRDN